MTPTVTSAGPLRRIVAAIEAGAASRAEVAARAGLDRQIVDAALEHLIRSGRLNSERIGVACPDTGCGRCPSGRADGTAGCGASGPQTSRGPVALTLTRGPR